MWPLDSIYGWDCSSGEMKKVDSSLKFYSTAEFDKYCDSGGYVILPDTTKDQYGGAIKWWYLDSSNWRPAEYWQNLYWRRLGCRLVVLKLNPQFLIFEGLPLPTKLHITEVKADSSFDSTWSW